MLAVAAFPTAARADALDGTIAQDLNFAEQQLRGTLASVPPGRYPFYTDPAGDWVTTGRRTWVAGLFPGSLWLLYEATGDPGWASVADGRQGPLRSQARDHSTTDLGFLLFDSFGNGYRLTGAEQYRHVVMRAAHSLGTRFDPAVGVIRAGGPAKRRDTAIVDNLINSELLFSAARHGGDPAWFGAALSNALLAAKNNVRPDGSVAQAVRYDWRTGRVKGRPPLQAHSSSSTWARGQAWAIYGFTMAYRESGDPRLLTAARSTADWFIAHLPSDDVPYWDFAAPGIPNAPRDSSAAAIAASGLLELAALDPDVDRDAGYHAAADTILASLSSDSYLGNGSDTSAILLHGTQREKRGNVDTGLIEGDYYFIEALLRHLTPPSPPAQPTEVLVQGGGSGVRKGLRRGVRLRVRTSEPGRIRSALIPRRKTARALGRNGRHLDVVGRSNAQVAGQGWTTIRVPISRRGRRHLRHRSSAKLVASVVLEGAEGGSDATVASLKLNRR